MVFPLIVIFTQFEHCQCYTYMIISLPLGEDRGGGLCVVTRESGVEGSPDRR